MATPQFSRELTATLKLSMPIVLSELIQAATPFAGTVMTARLGESELAASALVNIAWFALTVFFLGIFNAISVMIAQEHGADNMEGISRIMGQGLILTLLVSLIVPLILLLEPSVIAWTGQSYRILRLATTYTYAMIWVFPPLILLMLLEQFLIGIQRARIVLWISLVQIPVEIAAMYGLVFGKWGLPALGLAGVAYGQAIVFTLGALFISLYAGWEKTLKRFNIFSALRLKHYPYLIALFKIGVPIGAMYAIEEGAFLIATIMMGLISATALAAHQIIIQFASVSIIIIIGIAQAVTVRVGYAIGRQRPQAIRWATYMGLGISTLITLSISAFYIVFAHQLMAFDMGAVTNQNAPLFRIGVIFFEIVAIVQIFDNFRLVFIGALRGMKDTGFAMFASFFAFWLIGLPLAYLIGIQWQWGGSGIWLALLIGVILSCFILYWRLKTKLKGFDSTIHGPG